MSIPTTIIEAGFNQQPSSTALIFDDVSRGKFDTATFGTTGGFSDITSYCRSFSTQRGRARALEQYSAGSATVLLSNADARFDPTNLSGAYAGGGVTQVLPMAPIRIRAIWAGVTYDIWRGYADSWLNQYPGVLDATATCAATDGFKVLTQYQNPNSIPAPTFVASTAVSTAATSVTVTSASTTVGDVLIALVGQGTGTATAVVPPAGWTALVTTTGYPGLQSYSHTVTASDPSSYVFANDPADGTAYTWDVVMLAYRGSSGVVQSVGASGGPSLSLAAPPVTTNVNNTLNIFAVRNAITIAGPSIVGRLTNFPESYTGRGYGVATHSVLYAAEVVQNVAGLTAVNPPDADLSNTAYWNAQYFVLAGAGVGAGEDTGARVTRVLNNASWPVADRNIDVGQSPVQATMLSDTALSEIQAVADAEQGFFYMSGDGKATFKQRQSRITGTRSHVVQAAFGTGPGTLEYTDIVLAYDDLLIKNTVTAAAKGGVPYTATDATSVAAYLTRTFSDTSLWLQLDSDAVQWANWIRLLYKDPELRIEAISVKPQSNDALWPVVLGLDIGDLVTVTHVTPAGTTISRQLFVEGIKHQNAATDQWQTTFSFSSASIQQSNIWLLLDDTTYGKLDTGAMAF